MSLRAKLLGLVMLATLLPALLLGWRFGVESDTKIADAVKRLTMVADNVAADLEHRVQGTAQLHYGLAHSGTLDSPNQSACSAFLSAVREAYPQYTGILTVRPDGQLHCDSLQSGRSLDLRDRSYFKRIVAGDTGVILEPVVGRLTGLAVLQVVYPARSDEGQLRFMLVASLNLQKFAQEAHHQLPLAVPELLLVDARGTVLAWIGRPDGGPKAGSSIADTEVFSLAQRLQGGGAGEVELEGGRRQVWAAAGSPTLRSAGLHLLLGQPRQALVAESHLRLRQGLLVLGGAALLLFAGVGWLAEWGIRRPVGRIISMVRELGAGNPGARIAPPFPRGELGALMTVLNGTADSLQQQRQAIDELGVRLREAHMRELTDRLQNEARLSRMANFDSLTGLPNRTQFRDRLQQAVERAQRSGRPFALMFLDLDRFKNINDSLGHDVGDRLLVAVAEALAGTIRTTDVLARPQHETAEAGIFRLGGDEFTFLIEGLHGRSDVNGVAERILAALGRPFIVGEHELFISGSLGITVYAGGGIDLDGLVKQADMAMYRAKDLGRDTYCFFDEELHREANERHRLEALLRHALDRGEFRLHYQPKADLASGRVNGVEALLRWQPAGQETIGPQRFIPILEETGLIVAVGAWVFREACGQMMRWRQQGMRSLTLAVNLSAQQFRHQDLVADISQVLAETGFDPSLLEVELTESMLIEDSESVLGIMTRLGAMGVRIAIDDFGTGHSSLSYLKRFDVDTLKIDRSFIKEMPDDVELGAIAEAVIALGHGLKLKVVAEGVETAAQAEFLRERGCDELQGYLLSRPLEPEAFAAWFEQRETLVSIELA